MAGEREEMWKEGDRETQRKEIVREKRGGRKWEREKYREKK